MNSELNSMQQHTLIMLQLVPKAFYARQHICYSAYMLSPVRLSVCLSVTQVDHTKTVEVRIMKLAPPGSPMILVF